MTHCTLIDKYLPAFTFSEYHSIMVTGTMERVYQAARDMDMSRSRLVVWLFRLRGLPTKRMNLQGFISDVGFTMIEEDVPKEILMGFWTRWGIAPITGYEDFVRNSISARIKVVWNFYLEEVSPDHIRLSTETRVQCMNPLIRLIFGLYWLLIRPFSGLIRLKMLEIIKQDVEKGAPCD